MKNKSIHSDAQAILGDFCPEFVAYTDDILFEDVWRGEVLPLRDRSLITIGALVAGGHVEQLSYHFKLAIENKISETEIVAILTHLAFYVGWPSAVDAMQLAKKLFNEESKY